jgi:hypothetical protein
MLEIDRCACVSYGGQQAAVGKKFTQPPRGACMVYFIRASDRFDWATMCDSNADVLDQFSGFSGWLAGGTSAKCERIKHRPFTRLAALIG